MKYSNIKNLLLPIGIIVTVLVLGVIVANFLVTRINSTLALTREQETKNQVLKDRLSTLQELSDEIRTSVNSATLAVPEGNPSVAIISQIKSLANVYNVLLSSLATTSGGTTIESQVVTYDVSFEAETNDYNSLSSFIENLSKITPLVNLSSVRITTLAQDIKAEVKLTGYSSPFPAELPAIDAPISGLTADETATLNTIGGFSHPTVSEPGVIQEILPREDPFSLSP